MPKTLAKKHTEGKSRAKKHGLTEAQIAVHWKEEAYIRPPARFIAQANLNDNYALERFSEKNFPECFREYAELLHWDQYWHTTLDTNHPPFWKWFVGGRLNVCLQLRGSLGMRSSHRSRPRRHPAPAPCRLTSARAKEHYSASGFFGAAPGSWRLRARLRRDAPRMQPMAPCCLAVFIFQGSESVVPKTLVKKHTEGEPRARARPDRGAASHVHCNEKPILRPPARFIAQANLNDNYALERFSEKTFPRVLPRICRTPPPGSVSAHHARTPTIRPSGSGSSAAA